MSIKVFFEGTEIQASPSDLGEVLRQIRALKGPPERLPVSQQPVQAPAPSAPAPQEYSPARPSQTDEERAVLFLRLIETHQAHGGATGGQIAHLMKLKHPKGIGSKAVMVNKLIESHGYAVPDVYRNPRDSTGERHWIAGPKLKEAIEAIEKGVRLA